MALLVPHVTLNLLSYGETVPVPVYSLPVPDGPHPSILPFPSLPEQVSTGVVRKLMVGAVALRKTPLVTAPWLTDTETVR